MEYYDSRSCSDAVEGLHLADFHGTRLVSEYIWDNLPISHNNFCSSRPKNDHFFSIDRRQSADAYHVDRPLKATSDRRSSYEPRSEKRRSEHECAYHSVEPIHKMSRISESEIFTIETKGERKRCTTVDIEVSEILGKPVERDKSVEASLKTPNFTEEKPLDDDQISSPHLLAQMSDLLCSLQNAAPGTPTRALPSGTTNSVVSSGGTVAPRKAAKVTEPTVESVQQLAQLLLQQSKGL